jgi:hypothetical protein
MPYLSCILVRNTLFSFIVDRRFNDVFICYYVTNGKFQFETVKFSFFRFVVRRKILTGILELGAK